MERGNGSHLKSNLVRIKRLFPGQPAEEHGAIVAGDIILAVNGKPIEGLAFQVPRALGVGGTDLDGSWGWGAQIWMGAGVGSTDLDGSWGWRAQIWIGAGGGEHRSGWELI